jgi:hypothetical protein
VRYHEQPADGSMTIETYDTDLGTVFYDIDNPLAWIESSVVTEVPP